jgi:hypothetical protein
MQPVPKSHFPYLVDIGVTTMCAKNCKYCYAAATHSGKHAEAYFLSSIMARELLDSNVFEVVLGGYGEPTLWNGHNGGSGIEYIARAYKEMRFKVGLTTANYEWNDALCFAATIQYLDSVAISCNSVNDIGKAVALADAISRVEGNMGGPVVSIQTIAGLLPWEKTLTILKGAVAEPSWVRNVTILGYHACGRGKKIVPHEIPRTWINDIKALEGVSIGIDATMVSAWGDQLIESGVESYRLTGSEGRQTCFVDAVGKKIKPSSFSDESYDWSDGNFLKIFSKF